MLHSFLKLHTTLYFQILDNVAYDIIGHCYFLEDGAEKATILDGNLGALIKSADHNGFTTDRTYVTYL